MGAKRKLTYEELDELNTLLSDTLNECQEGRVKDKARFKEAIRKARLKPKKRWQTY